MSLRLLIISLIFGALLLGVFFHENTDVFVKSPPPKTGQLPLFSFMEQDLGRVEVIFNGSSSVLSKDPDGKWFLLGSHHMLEGEHSHSDEGLHEHDHVELDRSLEIQKQLAVTVRMIGDRKLKVSQMKSFSDSVVCIEDPIHAHVTNNRDDCVSLAALGLENPSIVIAFYPREKGGKNSSSPLETLYVGDMLPSEYTYYTRKGSESDIYLVPRYFIAMLLTVMFGPEQAPSIRPD